MLVDTAIIQVCSGQGGDGCASFRREKFVPKGGPDGGDGGRGGSVMAVADPAVTTLLDFSGRHHWRADNGGPGMSKQCHGRDSADLYIRVPPGTLIYNDQTGKLIVDLAPGGQPVQIARGGRGGFGNEHFKSPTRQTPTQCTRGEPAEELTLRLELKLIADVGLVGKPNAGKSTLLARITRARPKIADYPFTTVSAQLGIAELSGAARRLVVADIPGLIENAHRGQGLGTRFLRHIERTRLLVHLVEIHPVDGSDPAANYHIVRRELGGYSPALLEKPELVVFSKMDLAGAEADWAAAARRLEEALGTAVQPISAVSGLGLAELLEACWAQLGGTRLRGRGWQKDAP